MAKCSLSTIGTSTLVDSYHIKRSRYCLQVSVAAIYKLLKIAHSRSGSELSPLEWLDQSSLNSQMCFYWRMILNFQLLVLLHVHSIREGKFKLYLDTLYQGLKWYFALDKYNLC